MLLAGLQRKAVGRFAVHIHTDAHQAARHGAFKFVATGQEGGVRATGAHGHAKALRAAHHNVGAHFARRFEQRQCQQIRGHDDGPASSFVAINPLAVIPHHSVQSGVLQQHRKAIILKCLGAFANTYLDAQWRGARADNCKCLRQHLVVHVKNVASDLYRAPRQGHGLGSSRGFVQHGGVGDRHSRQIAHHGLKIHQGLHTALADLGLVRRIGGVPGGVFQNVAQNHTRCVRAVIALANEAFEHPVVRGHGTQFSQRCCLTDGRGQIHGRAAPDIGRDDACNQALARRFADGRQHVRLVLR